MKNLFNVHKKEKLGLSIFLIVAVVGAGVIYFLPRWLWPHKKELLEVTLNKKGLNQEKSVHEFVQNHKKETKQVKEKVEITVPENSINPNSATLNDWVSLGLSEKQGQVILNYVSKGGSFYNKADLKKMYSITEKNLERMLPYLYFEDKPTKPSYQSKTKDLQTSKKEVEQKKAPIKEVKININEATAEAFQEIRGIGPVLSKRITEFRDRLGGFHDKQQLREVYGLPEDVADQLIKQSSLKPKVVKKININTASSDELYQHPYLRAHRKDILDLRKKKGGIKDLEELKQKLLINDENYRKIAPYLAL